MNIFLAHDYLTQRGGAERVALELAHAFPSSPMWTSVYEPLGTFPGFSDFDIRTTWLQKVFLARRDPRPFLPILPNVFDSIAPVESDILLASSTGFAHGIRAAPGCKKVVYCHNPPRWLYQSREYLSSRRQEVALRVLRARLEKWDMAAAHSADMYIANSTTVARRILEVYGIHAKVVHPPVALDPEGPSEPIAGLEPGFWLSISRARGYKNVQNIASAVEMLTSDRLVVAGAGSTGVTGRNTLALGVVTESQLRWLYKNARALVSVAFEDFGLTPLEANLFGTPVAVLRAGGFLDSTHEGVSGTFISGVDVNSIHESLESFPDFDPSKVRAHAAKFSSAAFRQRVVHELGRA